MKRTLMIAALAGALAVPAMAQQQPMSGSSTSTPSTSAAPMTNSTSTQQPGFVQQQDQSEWRSSKLVGTSVYGPDNSSIGEINDLILADNGQIKAAVVGVGGFLGVGQKDVAVPFQALNVKRKENSASIDKITVSFTKDQLKNAPNFAYYSPSGQSQTTGSGTTSSSPMGSPAHPAGTPMNR
ncbi:MAG TPA: PRC-barrel domain-containing protein [Pseudolabrys sp.]|nr:PRC-barrel domain-containing protein [Pseudolabrys sp.]